MFTLLSVNMLIIEHWNKRRPPTASNISSLGTSNKRTRALLTTTNYNFLRRLGYKVNPRHKPRGYVERTEKAHFRR